MSTLARTPDQMPDTAAPEPTPEGLRPTPQPRFAHLLAAYDQAKPPKPTATGTPFRFSDANGCARKLAFKALGEPASNPIDLSGHNNFALGTLIHEAWQAILADQGEGLEAVEGKAEIDGLTSGHYDALLTYTQHGQHHREILELKSIGGFGFKLAVGAMSGPAEGPKADHIVQLALNVVANGATRGTLVYISKESVSVNVAKKNGLSETDRFCAEWTFERDWLQPIADKEVRRLEVIKALVDEGKLAPAHIPDLLPPGARVVNAKTGRWELRAPLAPDGVDPAGPEDTVMVVTDTGNAWACGYCSHQDVCDTYDDRETPEWRGGA